MKGHRAGPLPDIGGRGPVGSGPPQGIPGIPGVNLAVSRGRRGRPVNRTGSGTSGPGGRLEEIA